MPGYILIFRWNHQSSSSPRRVNCLTHINYSDFGIDLSIVFPLQHLNELGFSDLAVDATSLGGLSLSLFTWMRAFQIIATLSGFTSLILLTALARDVTSIFGLGREDLAHHSFFHLLGLSELRLRGYYFFSCYFRWASICLSQLSIVSEIKLINILTTVVSSMSVVKNSLLNELASKLGSAQLKALTQRLQAESSPIHNKSPEFYSTKTSLDTTKSTGLRRPLRHKQSHHGDSPQPNNFSKTVGTTSLQPNKQRAIFYRQQGDLPNLHSQDLLDALYTQDQCNPTTPTPWPLRQFQNINRSLTPVQLSNLKQLQLYYCNIQSFRSLGTGWKIRSLTIIGSTLTDFGGISGFALLEDLFVSYNRISDVSHLSYHQTLRSLDLEGNALAEIEQIEYLETVENLEYVNLEHNPVAQGESRHELERRFGARLGCGEWEGSDVSDDDIWDAYAGYEDVAAVDEVNRKLLQDRQNAKNEVILCLQQQHLATSSSVYSQSLLNPSTLLSPLHTLHKPSPNLSQSTLSYLDSKLLPENMVDGSRSRSKPKLLQVLSKDKLKLGGNEEVSEMRESKQSFREQMRETIRMEARKKFLVRRGSVRKDNVGAGVASPGLGLAEVNLGESMRVRPGRLLLKSCVNRLS